jgi:hypothetical protein
MSLVSIFVDAFNKARQPKKPEIDIKSVGPMGSTAAGNADAFDPLRPAPEPDSGKGIDHGGVAEVGEPGASPPDKSPAG